MATIFTVPELVWIIVTYLRARADVSALSQCCRSFHTITAPMLYRDLEFSIFRVDSIAEAMKRNRFFPAHCRSLSITLKGSPRPRHAGAYFTQSDAFADEPAYAIREGILIDLTYVLDQCSVHGSIHHFSWDLTMGNTSLAFDWLVKAFKSWRSFISLGRSLQTLRYSVRKANTSFDDTVGDLVRRMSTLAEGYPLYRVFSQTIFFRILPNLF